MRGKPTTRRVRFARLRLIPTCAGKTWAFSPRVEPSWAHPRMCGENDATDKFQNTLKGSSPRMRGKLPYLNDLMDRGRLIPACAGKTPVTALHGDAPAADPRVCGENTKPYAARLKALGSSPRVREKLPQHTAHVFDAGLIPACAGKTYR